jgi:hypothetical protein
MRWRVNDSTHVLERDTSHPAAAPYSYFLNAHQTCFEKYSLMFKNENREGRGNEKNRKIKMKENGVGDRRALPRI